MGLNHPFTISTLHENIHIISSPFPNLPFPSSKTYTISCLQAHNIQYLRDFHKTVKEYELRRKKKKARDQKCISSKEHYEEIYDINYTSSEYDTWLSMITECLYIISYVQNSHAYNVISPPPRLFLHNIMTFTHSLSGFCSHLIT